MIFEKKNHQQTSAIYKNKPLIKEELHPVALTLSLFKYPQILRRLRLPIFFGVISCKAYLVLTLIARGLSE